MPRGSPGALASRPDGPARSSQRAPLHSAATRQGSRIAGLVSGYAMFVPRRLQRVRCRRPGVRARHRLGLMHCVEPVSRAIQYRLVPGFWFLRQSGTSPERTSASSFPVCVRRTMWTTGDAAMLNRVRGRAARGERETLRLNKGR